MSFSGHHLEIFCLTSAKKNMNSFTRLDSQLQMLWDAYSRQNPPDVATWGSCAIDAKRNTSCF